MFDARGNHPLDYSCSPHLNTIPSRGRSMANKKRKTLQIKRPDPNSVQAKKKPLPKVKLDEQAATSSVDTGAIDTDELTSMGPKTAKVKRSDDSGGSGHKGATTRISLPDEDKIRRA